MPYEITVTESTGIARRRDPVVVGIPFAVGAEIATAAWAIMDETGRILPSQWKPLALHQDGSLRALHGVFLADFDAGQTRAFTLAPGTTFSGPSLIRETRAGLSVNTGPMTADFNPRGELVSLCLQGLEVLDTAAGPSMELSVGLWPYGNRPPPSAGLASQGRVRLTIKESGPVRAILNLRGSLSRADRRGAMTIQVDADYVFYAGCAEIHVAPMLLGAVTEAAVIDDWSLRFNLRNGKRLAYGREPILVRKNPNHEHMRGCGLPEGWVCWALNDGVGLTAWSADFQRHRNGCVHTLARGEKQEGLQVTFSRVEPNWGYNDVSQPASPITINRGGWRRWEAVFALHGEDEDPRALARRWASPLRAHPSPSHYRQALAPWLEGYSIPTPLKDKVSAKCAEFVCREPEYSGSLYGGWDGNHNTYLERGVSRGDFGEYLLNEFFRSGDTRFYRMGFEFGQIYRDIYCFTIPEASDGPHELGAARPRQTEHGACPIRSYRGGVLLAYLYGETGDERYLEALRQRAAFHLANYPHRVGRLSMSVRDSAYMAGYLHQPALLEKALQNTRHSLDRHFDPEHGFYEAYDESHPLPDGRFPPLAAPEGEWVVGDFLRTSNASPEMTAYNIIGWYGLTRLHNPGPDIMAKIRRVCEWFRDHQFPDGSWPYPHDTSTTRWGHGCLQDALAMLYARKLFGDPSFLASAEKSLAFTGRLLDRDGRVPLILGILPQEATEDSLTYYYGIETLAIHAEIRKDEKVKQTSP